MKNSYEKTKVILIGAGACGTIYADQMAQKTLEFT